MRTRVALALVCGLALWAMPAVSAPQADGFDPATMMRASEVRPGMLGVGKSVFLGERIEEFHVRLLGVLPKANTGTDLVLCQILDGPPVTQKAGVIAGMSGSPVYVNGRLLGAVAYGWAFAREPIGGITPIEYMLRAFQAGAPPVRATAAGTVTLPRPLGIGGKTIRRVTVQRSFQAPAVEAPGTLTLRPLGGFATAVGFQGRSLERLRTLLEPLGLTLVQGGAAGGDFGSGEMLQPGAAMALSLVTGDIEVGGVGTLTYRSGNRVLAFGHPFMEMTDPIVDVPLATARVLSVFPSYLESFKLSSSGRVVGRITRDRAWAIGGEVGKPAEMLPVAVEINTESGTRSFHMQVVRHRMLTPGLAATAVMAAADQALGYIGEGTAQVTLKVAPHGRAAIVRQDVVYSRDLSAALMMQVAEPLATFTDTPYGTLEFDQVELKVRVRPTHDTAVVERIYTTQTKAKAGEDLELNIVLHPFAKEKVTQKVVLHIPDEIPTGMLRIGVCGGFEAERMRASLNLARITPITLDQMVQRYQSREPANQLTVLMALPTPGVSLPDQSLPSLPASVGAVLSATRSSAITRIADELKVAEPSEWMIQGRQVIALPVEGRPGAAKAVPAPPPPQAGPPPGEGPPEDSGGPDEGPDLGDFEAAAPAMGSDSAPSDLSPPTPRDAGDEEALAGAAGDDEEGAAPPQGAPAGRPGGGGAPPEAGKPPAKKPETPKPVIRQPARWIEDSREDLERGRLRGVSLDTDGGLALAPGDGPQWEVPAQGVWSLAALQGHPALQDPEVPQDRREGGPSGSPERAASDQAAYAGTGYRGVIYKLTAEAKPASFFETGQAIVHSLLLDPAGNLYAGTSPHGLIYKIGPDGKGAVFCDTKQTYVWALAFDAQGRLLAGTGPNGLVFRIGPDGKGEQLAAFQAPHVLCLAPGPKGELYAGTGNNAVIYRISPDGGVVALFDRPGGQVHGLALGEQGELYAAVSPTGAIYRITPGGAAESFFATGDNLIFALLRRGGALYTATGGKGLAFRIRDDKVGDLLLKPENGQALCLTFNGAGDLYVGEANPSLVRRLDAKHRPSGAFESGVLDAGATARWGTLSWYAQTPKGARVALQTRSGNTADPKDRWSAWSDEIGAPGHLIASPAARYFQYRVNLGSDDAAANPRVGDIQIDYLPKDRPPTVALSAPVLGDWWSKKQKIAWKGEDRDKDTLLYDLYYSVDSSAHWEPLKEATKDASFEWDTTKIEDGLYTVKVTATDRLTSPADPETDEDTALVGVDNTPPTAFVLRHTMTVGKDRRVTLRGDAWDKTSSVRGVDYRVDGKDWLTATPSDGLFDGRDAWFTVTTDPLAVGDHTIEVRALDAASNAGTDKVSVTVKPPEKPAPPKPEQAPKPEAAAAAAPEAAPRAEPAPKPAEAPKPEAAAAPAAGK